MLRLVRRFRTLRTAGRCSRGRRTRSQRRRCRLFHFIFLDFILAYGTYVWRTLYIHQRGATRKRATREEEEEPTAAAPRKKQ